ncbi:hypothetical protein JCM3770_001416, partial [Rhodotorula araucariae]
MHEQHSTENSLLEADGLAEFAAAQSAVRHGASSRSDGGEADRAYGGLRSTGDVNERCAWQTSADYPPTPPARYDPLAVAHSSWSPDAPTPMAPVRTGAQAYPPYAAPWTSHSTSPRFAPPSFPSPSLQPDFDPARPVARPPLTRGWGGQTWRSAPPAPTRSSWVTEDPYARSRDYRGGGELVDGRGDLGAGAGWSAWTPGGGAASVYDGDDDDGPAAGEWTAPAGSYLHGVGFDDRWHLPPAGFDAKAQRRRQERIERRFGGLPGPQPSSPSGSGRGRTPLEEATGVDSSGRLLTLGRRKRLFLRWAQATLALVVGASAIGAAFTHTDPTPTPAGSAPHWALIVLPFLSLALSTYCSAARPCLVRRRGREESLRGGLGAAGVHEGLGAAGVFPLQQQPQSGSGLFRGGKKREHVPAGAGMSVNLVVDPRFLPGFAAGVTGGDDAAWQRRKDRRRRKKRRAERRRRRRAAARTATGGDDTASSSSSSSSSSPSPAAAAAPPGAG